MGWNAPAATTDPVSLTKDSNNNVWFAFAVCDYTDCPTTQDIIVFKWTNSTSTWASSETITDGPGDVQMVALTSGKLAVTTCTTSCYITTYSGTTWNAPTLIVSSLSQSSSTTTFTAMSAVSISNTTYLLYEDTNSSSGGLKFLSYPYGGSVSSITKISSVTSVDTMVGLTLAGGQLFATYADSSSSTIASFSSSNLGAYWSLANNITSSESGIIGASYTAPSSVG